MQMYNWTRKFSGMQFKWTGEVTETKIEANKIAALARQKGLLARVVKNIDGYSIYVR